jgi:hypothetical protein
MIGRCAAGTLEATDPSSPEPPAVSAPATPSSQVGRQTAEAFFKICDDDSTILNYGPKGDAIETGARINDFCAGYLEGAFAAMVRAGVICDDGVADDEDAYFLRSVIKKYVADVPVHDSDRDGLVRTALARAFVCHKG